MVCGTHMHTEKGLAIEIGGSLIGNGGVARSMVSEITDESNRAKAFSLFGFCWGVGMIGKLMVDIRKDIVTDFFLAGKFSHGSLDDRKAVTDGSSLCGPISFRTRNR